MGNRGQRFGVVDKGGLRKDGEIHLFFSIVGIDQFSMNRGFSSNEPLPQPPAELRMMGIHHAPAGGPPVRSIIPHPAQESSLP